ncbi:hypothetical protein ACVBEF_13635 [Glaciimonas sp. GG7]
MIKQEMEIIDDSALDIISGGDGLIDDSLIQIGFIAKGVESLAGDLFTIV